VQQVFEISAPGMVGRPDSRSRSASTTCGGMCHAGMPPCAAAAWPAAVDNVLTVGLRANVSQRRSAAGPCRHSLRRQAPRVGWGACRHAIGGLFCQFDSEVVLFVNKLGRRGLFCQKFESWVSYVEKTKKSCDHVIENLKEIVHGVQRKMACSG
jgi:hypothetical protein